MESGSVDDNLDESPWHVSQPEFRFILGKSPQLNLILSNHAFPFAHEAGAMDPISGDIYFTSNQFTLNGRRTVLIGKLFKTPVYSSGSGSIPAAVLNTYHWQIINPVPGIAAANGGVYYVYQGRPGVLFCQQGQDGDGLGSGTGSTNPGSPTANVDSQDSPSALVHMGLADSKYVCRIIVDSFYGKPFNSPNDVAILRLDQTIWFTDPSYAYIQGLKSGKPQLPNLVYCYNPANKSIRVVADGFVQPNGIAFSPDCKTLYITDTGAYVGDSDAHGKKGKIDNTAPSTVYAFDVVRPSGSSIGPSPSAGYHLVNRRVFAFTDCPAPDGIKTDLRGNVYAACQDGIHVWSVWGVLLGKIRIPGGVANFCFTNHNTLVLLNEHRIFEAILSGL